MGASLREPAASEDILPRFPGAATPSTEELRFLRSRGSAGAAQSRFVGRTPTTRKILRRGGLQNSLQCSSGVIKGMEVD